MLALYTYIQKHDLVVDLIIVQKTKQLIATSIKCKLQADKYHKAVTLF